MLTEKLFVPILSECITNLFCMMLKVNPSLMVVSIRIVCLTRGEYRKKVPYYYYVVFHTPHSYRKS